jgi:Type II secretion system (T2SS), protein N
LRAALILAAIIFIVTVLARLPADVLVSHLPSDIACEDVSGTLWHGTCGQLGSNGFNVAALSWSLHPLALLKLRVSADLISSDPAGGGSARVVLIRGGDVAISDLHATLPLPAGSPWLPGGASATLALTLPSVKLHNDRLVAIEGTVDVQQLHISNPAADLGDYELQIQPQASASAPTIEGQIRDLNGPLAVSGLLRLQPSGEYDINGTVAPRGSVSEDLNKALQFLGPADAQGQRTFSLAGTM